MIEPIKSNLEPIEDADLDLEGKIKRGISTTSTEQNEKPLVSLEQEKPHEVSAAEKDSAYGNILSKVQSKATDDSDSAGVLQDAEEGSKKMDAETQVQHLVDIAMQKGVVHAVKVARHMENNYILDTFHDKLLADELHDALMKKGLLSEE